MRVGVVVHVRVVVCLAALAVPAAASAVTRSVPGTALEAPAVREAIRHESMQEPGPLASTAGATGDSSEPATPPGGELEEGLSTPNSNTWTVGRENQVTRIFAAPVNYRGSDARWHAIDNTLVPAAMGGYENQANSFTLRVPNSLSTGLSLEAGGNSISAALQGGKEAMPAVAGGTARYSEALTSTDLEYESTSTGVKETATLKDPNAPQAIRFSLSATGSLSAKATTGGIAVLDAEGKTAFALPAAVAYRPGQDPGTGRQLPMSLTATSNGWTLTIDTSALWLREELAHGAVAVDPSLEVGGSQNCWVESDSPSTSFCSQTTMDVGYQSTEPAHEHHGLLQFNLSSLPEGADVLNARLGLYLQAHSTSNSKPVGVYRVTKPWTTSATWEKYDATHAWTTAGGDYSTGEDAVVNSSVGTTTGWNYWYPTKMVQEWANGSNEAEEGAPNDGLIIKDETDNTINNVLTYSSIRATEHKPFLEVAYEKQGVGREPQWTILNYPIADKITVAANVASGNLIVENADLHIAGRSEDFASTRRYNSVDPNVKDYGRFNDSNDRRGAEFADGSFEFLDETDAHYVFVKKPDGTFVTPPGIKAVLCTAGHPPCPATLPTGVARRLVYDADNRHIDFTPSGAVSRKGDRHENVLTAGFTEGNLTSWTDTQSRKITYKTNAVGFYTEINDEAGARKLTYEYEGTGTAAQLIGYKDAGGHTTKYHYEFGDLNKITTPAGHVTLLKYNSTHQIASIVRTTNIEHTSGPTTKFTYYALGAEHNPCGTSLKATVVTDPDGVAEREKGPPETETSHTTTYCSNVHDEIVKTLDANGKESQATFDGSGNTRTMTAAPRETGAIAGLTSLVYGTGGANLACVEQSGKETSSCPTEALPEGFSSRYSYGDATFGFQPTEAISPRQKTTKLCYWGGSVACGAGEALAPGELKQEKLPLAGEPGPTDEYNKEGLTTSSTDADGHTTHYEYDASGNLKTITPPSGSGKYKVTITDDAVSRPHVITQCLNETCSSSDVATLSYDALDRLTEAVYTGPGATKTFKYTFDTDGNLAKQVEPAGTTSYKHDAVNRITEEAFPGGAANAYGYDEASNLTTLTDSGGVTTYLYNKLNELEAMFEPEGNCGTTPVKCTTFAHDNDGAVTKIRYPSGATLNYTLDATTGRTKEISAKNPAGTTVMSNTYAYLEGTSDTPMVYKDTTSVSGSQTTETFYKYDVLDRLEEARTFSTSEPLRSRYAYEMDAVGARVKQEVASGSEFGGLKTFYVFNAGNELECRMKSEAACSKSSASEISGYSYDGAGNETAITGYSDPATTAFSYNNLEQLQGLTPPSASEKALSYVGTGQGLVSSVGSSSLQNSTLGVTKQVNGAGTSYYARAPGGLLVDQRLPGGATYNPVYDAQGDVVGLLNSSGELVQTTRYGPYGENTSTEGSVAYSATNDPFMFQGGYHMEGGNAGSGNVPNGTYHFGERYYDPTVGGWTQPDPGGDEGYGFAGDNPVNATDPTGECPADQGPGGGCSGHVCAKVIAVAPGHEKHCGQYGNLDVEFDQGPCNHAGCTVYYSASGVAVGARHPKLFLTAYIGARLIDRAGPVSYRSTPTFSGSAFLPFGEQLQFQLAVTVGTKAEYLQIRLEAAPG